MNDNRNSPKRRGFWVSIKDAKWWLLIGGVYGILSLIPVIDEGIRETLWSWLQETGGPILVNLVFCLLPAGWAIFLTSSLAQIQSVLYAVVPLAVALGATAGYVLKSLFDACRRNGYSKHIPGI